MSEPGGAAAARVLVVGINYAPEHAGISPYTTRACEHLAREGAQVLALAGVPHYPHWTVPPEYRRHLTVVEHREGVEVRRLLHYVPQRQSALRRGAYELSFGARVLTQRLPWTPTVVLAVVPSLFGAAAARVIARRTGARLVVWVQDLMGPAAAQSGIAGGSVVAGATRAVERSVLRAADTVLVLNEPFRRYAVDLGAEPRDVLLQPNWTHIDGPTGVDRDAVRRELGWAPEETVVLHSGNMGLKQALENVVDAARVADDRGAPLRFVLMGDGSQREHLERSASGVRRLQMLPPVDDDRFADVLAAADLLLVNERASATDMSLPSKLTSYMRAGRPVVAAVPPGGGTASEVERVGAGLVVAPEDPVALVDVVTGLRDDDPRTQRMAAAAVRCAEEELAAPAALDALTTRVLRGVSPGGLDHPRGRGAP